MTKSLSRRIFLDILGKGTVAVTLLPYATLACNEKTNKTPANTLIKGILPTNEDKLILAEGLESKLLISWKDAISNTDYFGFNNDYLCFIPLTPKGNEGLLWVNHEYVNPLFIHGNNSPKKTSQEIEQEQYNVGGSILHLKQTQNGWEIQKKSPYNKRITAKTPIPFNWDTPIKNSTIAIGTLGNCAGGITPWNTILTCEENYQDCYGDCTFDTGDFEPSWLGWEKYHTNPPEHYGWVVEINPKTGDAQKHVALGRCAHECATVVSLPDKRIVVYTGDDKKDECLYKFISNTPNSLKNGTLYVANTIKGKWIPIDINQSPILKTKFKTQTEALIYLRESAKLVGGTPLDRPEDIEIDPIDGTVLIALTNNTSKENYFGSILKITEHNNQHDSLTLKAQTYLTGGKETGFASPDNMIFDRKGNLWFTSDMSGELMNTPPYQQFKNNGLFIVMRNGKQAGEVIQLASAPNDAEFTGPWFSPDGKTLFLSVQHPGELSKSITQLTSNWPNGKNNIPKPSVVTISGKLLKQIQEIK